MKILILFLALFLTSCGYFEAAPDAVHYEYEDTTSLCAKVMEYPDRLVILYVNCQKAPGAKRVRYFGEGVGNGD
jgi:hypothetical protein